MKSEKHGFHSTTSRITHDNSGEVDTHQHRWIGFASGNGEAMTEGDDRKATLVTSLLQDSNVVGTGKKKLIEEINPTGNESLEDTSVSRSEPSQNKNATVVETEEVSLMDLMFAAHQEAKQASEIKKTKEKNQEAKTFGGGFKKGFLGGAGRSSEKKKQPKTSIQPASEDIPTIKPSPAATSSPLVMSDVQKAMKEESNPLLQQIQKGDWATPDLMNQLQDNPILSNGLKNPKCLAALQLLQSDPKEAQKRFQNDPDVSFFLQEFSKVMSQHFFSLGNQQEQQQRQGQPQQTQSPSSSSAPGIQEIGPLHAEVLARQKKQQRQQEQQFSSGNIVTTSAVAADSQCSDEQVKQVSDSPLPSPLSPSPLTSCSALCA
jgi:hypothetical protein